MLGHKKNTLIHLIEKLFSIEFIRFGIVGVIATAVHYGIAECYQYQCGFHDWISAEFLHELLA